MCKDAEKIKAGIAEGRRMLLDVAQALLPIAEGLTEKHEGSDDELAAPAAASLGSQNHVVPLMAGGGLVRNASQNAAEGRKP